MLIQQDGTTTQRTFTHIPTSIEAEEAEEIGVEHLLRDVASSSSAPSSSLLTAQSLSTKVASQLQALRGLHTRLAEIGEYLTLVRDGKLPINHQVIYQLQEVIGLLPQLGGDVDLGKAFRSGVNDQSIIVYLSSIVRTVLALHDLSELSPSLVINPANPLQLRIEYITLSRNWKMGNPRSQKNMTRQQKQQESRQQKLKRQSEKKKRIARTKQARSRSGLDL
jgi:26S proteasome regulatory subunit N8